MKRHTFLAILLALLMPVLAACGGDAQPAAVKAAVAPIALSADLSAIDLCKAIPPELFEAALGGKLVSAPERFEYYDTTGSSGCAFDAGKNAGGDARFGYAVLTRPEAYDQQPLYKEAKVSGIGEAAYFNNGADARQLWVKLGPEAALVVAIGDAPNEAALKQIAGAIIVAVK
jgi:hypothetical protein